MKVVINDCFGGYGLSKKAYKWLGKKWDDFGFLFEDDRTNERLIKCVEALKEEANGEYASLKIVDIPDDIEYTIHSFDGIESIHELHREWR